MPDCKSCDPIKLPLGLISFSNIRKSNMIYVDKTALMASLAIQRVPIFFSRPRRFGKSLLINTLHSLFEKGLEDFKGLAIEKIWQDTIYKVVHLDFSRLASKDPQGLKRALGKKIIQEFCAEDTVFQSDALGLKDPDMILDEIASKLKDNSIILLIDEYDAPLTHHLDIPDQLQSITEILNDFYATIKQYTDKFRFIFITGIIRASHVSIFSAFNNLLDLSLDSNYNSLLGFTQNELRIFFDHYIENAANTLKIPKNEIYWKLEQYYDGFHFSLSEKETVYNPWSVLNFLAFPQNGFKNYWFKSGGTSSILIQYLKIGDSFDFINYNDRDIHIEEEEISGIYDIDKIPRHILLYQAGYFTIRNENDGTVRLVIPNGEVEESLFRLYLTANNLAPQTELRQKMKELSIAIDSKNLSFIVDLFNTILNECVSISNLIFNDERSVRDIIYAALLKVPSLQKVKEHETRKGRSDLELITKKTCMIIEFKRTYAERGPRASLKKATEQIANNQYGLFFSHSHTLYRVGMVISTEKRMILHDFCKEVP